MYKLDTLYYNSIKFQRKVVQAMTDLNSLKKLTRENGYLYTKDVTESGIRREILKKYLDQGILIRESRGIYSFSGNNND